MADGFIQFGDGFIQFGDGPRVPAKDIKMDVTWELPEPPQGLPLFRDFEVTLPIPLEAGQAICRAIGLTEMADRIEFMTHPDLVEMEEGTDGAE